MVTGLVVTCPTDTDWPSDWGRWSPHRGFSGSRCPRRQASWILQEDNHLFNSWARGRGAPGCHIWGSWLNDSPRLCGQSSRWKRTIRGLFLKHKSASFKWNHWLEWKRVSVAGLFLTLISPSREPPHRSEPRSADRPNLDTHRHFLNIHHTAL